MSVYAISPNFPHRTLAAAVVLWAIGCGSSSDDASPSNLQAGGGHASNSAGSGGAQLIAGSGGGSAGVYGGNAGARGGAGGITGAPGAGGAGGAGDGDLGRAGTIPTASGGRAASVGAGGGIASGTGGTGVGGANAPLDGGPSVSGAFLDGFFPIGVWDQPMNLFATWKGRGVNTLVNVAGGEDITAWDAEARKQGLRMIRSPLPDPKLDIGRTDLLAWLQADEPDVEATNITGCGSTCNKANCAQSGTPQAWGSNCTTLLQSQHTTRRSVDPNRKLFVNFSGSDVLMSSACNYCNGAGDEPPNPTGCQAPHTAFNDQCYPSLIAAADWISHDIYPVTGWLPDAKSRNDVSLVGKALDKLARWTNKPLFAFVETSFQDLTGNGVGTRGVTPAEFRAEVWNAIIHGARGVFYFSIAFPYSAGCNCHDFAWDATPPDVLAEMTAQNATITQLSGVLQGAINPPSPSASVAAPLEVGWRKNGNESYFFVLNLSNAAVDAASVQLTGVGTAASATVYGESRSVSLSNGAFTDKFGPYALHIYVVSP